MSAVPGVAIAVALLPPLASAGVLFYLNAPVLASRALLLYAANLAAILSAGSVIFLLMGLTPRVSLRRFGPRIFVGAAIAAILVS